MVEQTQEPINLQASQEITQELASVGKWTKSSPSIEFVDDARPHEQPDQEIAIIAAEMKHRPNASVPLHEAAGANSNDVTVTAVQQIAKEDQENQSSSWYSSSS